MPAEGLVRVRAMLRARVRVLARVIARARARARARDGDRASDASRGRHLTWGVLLRSSLVISRTNEIASAEVRSLGPG